MKRSLLVLIVALFLPQLTSAQGENLTGVNCAVTPDQLLGQANVGYAGAANVGYAGAAGDIVRNSNLELDAAQIVADWQYSSSGEEPVAIVIIDDFSSDEPVDAANWSTASHGWLVNEVFMRLYEQLPPEVADNIQFEYID